MRPPRPRAVSSEQEIALIAPLITHNALASARPVGQRECEQTQPEISQMHRLYHLPLSPFCRKIRLVLAEKRVEVELIEEATNSFTGSIDDSNSKLVSNLEEQLYNSVDTVNKLELELEDLRKERDETVATLETDKDKLLSDLKAVHVTEVGVEKDQDPDASNLRPWN